MSDWMKQLAEAGLRQGWAVYQLRSGAWTFSKEAMTVTFKRTPETAVEWMYLVNTLVAAGLDFPERK